MRDFFPNHAIQILILYIVFFLFLANGLGLIEFQLKTNSFIRIPAYGENFGQFLSIVFLKIKSAEVITLLITGSILSFLLPLLGPVKASLLTAVSIIPSFYLGYSDFRTASLLPMEYSLLTILILYAMNVLLSYFIETHSRQKIVGLLGQYIPPELVSEISKQPEKINLEGEAKQLTVFFCDLQNFSGVAEQLNPKQLARLLNEYFTAMTTILYKHGATIDKYIGDSIMAFWGAPLPQSDHARRSVLAAFEMHEEIQRLANEFIKKGWPGPSMGIGVNTGIMNVGNMGSKYRIAYTVVGDAVNLASRLEALTRVYKVPTIVSESTKNEIRDIVFRELDLVQVKGKHNKTKIYQPVCLKSELSPELTQTLDKHHKALDYYFNKNWEKAQKLFKELKLNNKKDAYYDYLLEQIKKKQSL